MENKKKIKTLDIVLVICAVLAVAFTVTMIITFWKFQSEPVVLIGAFFGAITGEFGCCTFIWKKKLGKKEESTNEVE